MYHLPPDDYLTPDKGPSLSVCSFTIYSSPTCFCPPIKTPINHQTSSAIWWTIHLDDHLSTWKGSFAPNSSFFSPHSSLPLTNTTKAPKPADENWPPILLDEAHSVPKPILYCCWCCPASSTMTMTRRKTTLSHHNITSCPLINNTRVPYLALAATVNIASWVKKPQYL